MSKNVLGELCVDGSSGRDAVHVAILMVTAGEYLSPGDRVTVNQQGVATESWVSSIGVVDPFLKNNVECGDKFYVLMNPNQVTNLRHAWDCPGLPNDKVYVTEFVEQEKEVVRDYGYDSCSNC